MVSPYFVLILRHSPTSPLLPSLPAVLFPSHTGCGDLCFLASMCSFFCGNSSLIPFREALFFCLPPTWLGWGWPHLQPPGLDLYLKPDWQKYRIPSTMGIGWRWAGASSWANQNQPVVLWEVLGVWCEAGRMCQVLPGAMLLPGEKAVWVWSWHRR